MLYQLSYSRKNAFLHAHTVSLYQTHEGKFCTNGEGRIRTSEGGAGSFTDCSLWPLGNLSSVCERNLRKQPAPQTMYTYYKGLKVFLTTPQAPNRSSAGEGTRTLDLLITSQLLYQLSYASKNNNQRAQWCGKIHHSSNSGAPSFKWFQIRCQENSLGLWPLFCNITFF